MVKDLEKKLNSGITTLEKANSGGIHHFLPHIFLDWLDSIATT